MKQSEEVTKALEYIEERLKQYNQRDYYSRVQVPRERSDQGSRDWAGSSTAGREWAGSRWSGGRSM